jgi:hypothetical protein
MSIYGVTFIAWNSLAELQSKTPKLRKICPTLAVPSCGKC